MIRKNQIKWSKRAANSLPFRSLILNLTGRLLIHFFLPRLSFNLMWCYLFRSSLILIDNCLYKLKSDFRNCSNIFTSRSDINLGFFKSPLSFHFKHINLVFCAGVTYHIEKYIFNIYI